GLAGLSPAARTLIETARMLVGGPRHLGLVADAAPTATRLPWKSPIEETVQTLRSAAGTSTVVLASGDPLCYGVAALLLRHFPAEEITIIPQPSAFSLAAARLRWSLQECVCLSLHGRPLDRLRLHLGHHRKILALSTDGATPAAVAALLREAGWGPSAITVLEHMGGPGERRLEGIADTWTIARTADLNTIAIACAGPVSARSYSRLAGLPESAFSHDGQITKRVVRAATLAALAPQPFERLWDIGAGCGSIAIEWMRATECATAIAIEREPARAAFIARNASVLGVPELTIITGAAPAALRDLPTPDAVFVGGGDDEAIYETAWRALRPGGRLVANVLTLEGQARLFAWHRRHGGELTRLSVETAAPLGTRQAFQAQRGVTQLLLVKPS
ncbi:MAG TPA: precorrin-6y C5,15-methyltransferase (decarboxylating) subunit CbiE, partial [Stellaceae bacterium]|nr:precorrin-6y C5,15-methyltransferase (decarboxylating) subunit CbiE [Stellaceae bacterium]